MYTIRYEQGGRVITLQGSRADCHAAAHAIAHGVRGLVVQVWCGESCMHVYSFTR